MNLSSPAAPEQAPSAMRLVRVPCPACGSRGASFERLVEGYRLERCGTCDLVFVNPQPDRAELAALYRRKTPQSQADFYVSTVSPAQIFEYDRILGDLRTLSGGGGRLLDLGCAAGYFMQRAGAAGFEPHGVDVAPWVETIAAQRGVGNVRAVTLQQAAFPDAWFDVVHSSQVFEHLPQPVDELREIRRILKPGGVLYVNVPNYRCLSIVLGRDDFELNTPPEHVTYFTPRTLTRLLLHAGFSVVRTAAYGGVKWENLLGRPIRSEIAEAVRGQRGVRANHDAATHIVFRPVGRPSLPGRIVRHMLYRVFQVGMSLEAFARPRSPHANVHEF